MVYTVSKAIIVLTLAILTLSASLAWAQAQDDIRAEIEQIKQQLADMEALKARLAELEKKLEESEKTQAEMMRAQSQTSAVLTAISGIKTRVEGRIFAGVFATGDEGEFPNWSGDIPDAKLRFTSSPSDKITVVTRLSIGIGEPSFFDYVYLDYSGVPLPLGVLRVGQRKIDVGQETWTDNPVENILISNPVSRVTGYGIGVALRGALAKGVTYPQYEVGFVNGPRGVFSRPTSSLPFNIKVGGPFGNGLFASTSYFDSGRMGAANQSAISVANLASAPAGASAWRRNLWEIDLRYNYGPEGILCVIPSTNLPKYAFGATYGVFNDNATGVPDRDGTFWFVEGFYNINRKLYAAARYSEADLKDDVLALLADSPIPVNSYTRTSLGLGYKLTDLTHFKTEYSINNTTGGTPEPSLNQWAIGVASKF